jgi:putative membrane protein
MMTPLKRLHVSTLWVPLLSASWQLAIVALVGALFVGPGTVVFFGALYVLLPLAAFHALRYFTLRYRLQEPELFIRTGLFWLSERRIPLERIQDIRIQRGIFHQAFGVARLEITTAASEEQEAVLSVVSVAEAEQLRRAVFDHQAQRESGVTDDGKVGARGETLLRLGPRELILGAVTSRIVSTLVALVSAVLYFTLFLSFVRGISAQWETYLTTWEEKLLPKLGGWWSFLLAPFSWDDTLVGSVLLILGGLAVSLAAFVIRYQGYRLLRAGGVYSRSHGLFTIKSSSLNRDRIQALKIEESLLRRWIGLAAIWVDSGGDRAQVEEEKKRDPFVPVVRRWLAFRLAEQVLEGLPVAEPAWKRVSSLAIRRTTRVWWLILAACMAGNAWSWGWLVLVFLPGFPLAYFLSVQWYRNTGYWVDDDYLISRKGWFNRRTLYLPLRNIQTVAVRQSWFDRRLNLATLEVDTAGQSNTGGGTSVDNLPVEEARRLQQGLARRVAVLLPSNILASGASSGEVIA